MVYGGLTVVSGRGEVSGTVVHGNRREAICEMTAMPGLSISIALDDDGLRREKGEGGCG